MIICLSLMKFSLFTHLVSHNHRKLIVNTFVVIFLFSKSVLLFFVCCEQSMDDGSLIFCCKSLLSNRENSLKELDSLDAVIKNIFCCCEESLDDSQVTPVAHVFPYQERFQLQWTWLPHIVMSYLFCSLLWNFLWTENRLVPLWLRHCDFIETPLLVRWQLIYDFRPLMDVSFRSTWLLINLLARYKMFEDGREGKTERIGREQERTHRCTYTCIYTHMYISI